MDKIKQINLQEKFIKSRFRRDKNWGDLIGVGVADKEDLQRIGEDDPPVLPLVVAGLKDLDIRFPHRHSTPLPPSRVLGSWKEALKKYEQSAASLTGHR